MLMKCNMVIHKFILCYYAFFSKSRENGHLLSEQIINFDNCYGDEIESHRTLLHMNQFFRDEDRRCRFSLSSLACGQYLPGWSGLTFKQDLTNFQIV